MKNPFANFWFWIILFGELNVQMLMVGYGGFFGTLFSTTPMTFGMHLAAIIFGILSWGVAALAKISGPKVLQAMPEFGEDEAALERANKVKSASFKKKTDDEAEGDEDKTDEVEGDGDKAVEVEGGKHKVADGDGEKQWC